ncbi:glycoside hydrolase family 10 protein [Namhaeicola litoreus]|uniref:Glycoside hydrolase family 10 protein n=1 Tax=Namhaeicola litoreus TaxID=1052145 RepID=A0ABW3Y6B6_9FLAO
MQREFRGVWIATVENIDWPSSNNLSSEDQKKELISILDLYKSLNLNAVIFQIRPSADAFYKSKYEPWSFWLTGYDAQSPSPYYDPLAFAIDETHKRGMEFHAWLNPYRAIINYPEMKSKPLPLTYNKSEWFINYGKNKYFDPGNPEVRDYTNDIVADVVQQYDIDAIHFDDYFYPYKIENTKFNDDYSFKKYNDKYSETERDDWRRENVNTIIEELRHTIKSIKPWVQFGISPFGVWRNRDIDPRGSDTQAGQTNYDDLYADILLWMEKGWIDYLIPQNYWHIGNQLADYEKVARWWNQNHYDIPIYIGHGLYRLNRENNDKAWKIKNPTEIEKQLLLNKSLKNIKGSAYFSGKTFLQNPLNINKILKQNFYAQPVLAPLYNNQTNNIPEAVYDLQINKINSRTNQISFKKQKVNLEKDAIRFLIYFFEKGENVNYDNPKNIAWITGEASFLFNRKEFKNGIFAIFAVNRYNQLSMPSLIINE